MKMLALDDEIVDVLMDDYDMDDMDSHDAVIAAKALKVIDYSKSAEENAETIHGHSGCW